VYKRPYQKLIVLEEAHKLCIWIYRQTRDSPPEEKFGLVSQMRRSAYSIPMNISEENAKRSKRDKGRFFEMAASSLEELHYQCTPAKDLAYLSEKDYLEADDHIQQVSYLLTKLRTSVSALSSVSSNSSVSSVSS
jgi:four helix bundle protein